MQDFRLRQKKTFFLQKFGYHGKDSEVLSKSPLKVEKTWRSEFLSSGPPPNKGETCSEKSNFKPISGGYLRPTSGVDWGLDWGGVGWLVGGVEVGGFRNGTYMQ